MFAQLEKCRRERTALDLSAVWATRSTRLWNDTVAEPCAAAKGVAVVAVGPLAGQYREGSIMKLRLRDSSVTRGAKQRVSMALCLCASAIAAVLAEPTVMRADTAYVSSWNSDQILRFTTEGAG